MTSSWNKLVILSVLSLIESLSCVNMRIHLEENNRHCHIFRRQLSSREEFFFQMTYSQDNEFTWRRRQLTLLKRLSIWFRVVPEVLLLSLSCIWTGSTYRNGSKIVSNGKGFVPNRRVSRFPLIVNCDKWIRQGRGVEIRDQYNGIAQTWQLNYHTCCLFLYSLFVFVSCNEIGCGDDPW